MLNKKVLEAAIVKSLVPLRNKYKVTVYIPLLKDAIISLISKLCSIVEGGVNLLDFHLQLETFYDAAFFEILTLFWENRTIELFIKHKGIEWKPVNTLWISDILDSDKRKNATYFKMILKVKGKLFKMFKGTNGLIAIPFTKFIIKHFGQYIQVRRSENTSLLKIHLFDKVSISSKIVHLKYRNVKDQLPIKTQSIFISVSADSLCLDTNGWYTLIIHFILNKRKMTEQPFDFFHGSSIKSIKHIVALIYKYDTCFDLSSLATITRSMWYPPNAPETEKTEKTFLKFLKKYIR